MARLTALEGYRGSIQVEERVAGTPGEEINPPGNFTYQALDFINNPPDTIATVEYRVANNPNITRAFVDLQFDATFNVYVARIRYFDDAVSTTNPVLILEGNGGNGFYLPSNPAEGGIVQNTAQEYVDRILYNYGNTADDEFFGTGINDTIRAGQGNDYVESLGGNDNVSGDVGGDTLLTGDGNDTVSGGAGVDGIDGGIGNDTIDGGTEADFIRGNAGSDNIDGGGGVDSDYVYLEGAITDYVFEGTAGNFKATGKGFTDTIKNVEFLIFDANPNGQVATSALAFKQPNQPVETPTEFRGNGRANNLEGNELDNEIFGLGGNDILSGLAGDDDLHGGVGRDVLTGGADLDTFFLDTRIGKSQADVFTDFNRAEDTIALEGDVFRKLGEGVGKSELRYGTKAKDANDYLIYNQKNGNLYYDSDGNGDKGQILVAQIQTKVKITAADFDIV